MIKSVIVTNHLGKSLEIVLDNPELSGLAITSITGLGEADATINGTELAGSDYNAYNSSRLNKRNIVIDLKYWGDDIEASRLKSYQYFSTKNNITLRFITDHRDCECYGYVEKNTPNIFDPKSKAQISIMCLDPFFYGPNRILEDFAYVTPLFHFPFSDSRSGEIQFGELNKRQEKNIYYSGETEIGFTFKVHMLGNVTGLELTNVGTSEQVKINDTKLQAIAGQGFKMGDDLIINSEEGHKSAILLRNGLETNIINALDRRTKRPDWFKLYPGDNLFNYTATSGATNVQISIEYRILYKGV